MRHSTSADQRYADYGVGSEPGSDGIRLDVLKFGWPGTLTQEIFKAYEGDFIADPESGKAYLLESFNRKAETIMLNFGSELVSLFKRGDLTALERSAAAKKA